jgi:hypothetical protein
MDILMVLLLLLELLQCCYFIYCHCAAVHITATGSSDSVDFVRGVGNDVVVMLGTL